MKATCSLIKSGHMLVDDVLAPVPLTEPVADSPPPLIPRKRGYIVHARLGPDGRELLKIRQRGGWTQTEFARLLGIKVPRLVSYEHGRVLDVPAEFIDLARSIETQHYLIASLVSRPMSDLLGEWARMLGLDISHTRELAEVFGVSMPTICRWRNNAVKPMGNVLLSLHLKVVRRIAALNISKHAQSDRV